MSLALPFARGDLDALAMARERVDPLDLVRRGPDALTDLDVGDVTGVSVFLLDPVGAIGVRAIARTALPVRRAGARVRADSDTPFATIPRSDLPAARMVDRVEGAPGSLCLWHPGTEEALRLASLGQDAFLMGRTGDGIVHVGLVIEPLEEPDLSWVNLRWCGHLLGDDDSALALGAVTLVNWHRESLHCRVCGTRVETTSAGWTTTCPQCRTIEYPRQDPAVIMAVVDADDRVLMAHNAAWRPGFWSVLAGFVEGGEAPDRAVRREILEEVGIEVGDITYIGAQPWPFPRSLMLGFRARVVPGTLSVPRPDGVEIDRARFFSRAELGAAITSGEIEPPGPTAIARYMLEEWFGKPLPESPRRIDPLRRA